MSKLKEIFFVEVTDTYGGEANYSWVKRFKVHANSERGAISKVSRALGLKARKEWDTGDLSRYNYSGAALCAFLSGYEDQAENYFFVESI